LEIESDTPTIGLSTNDGTFESMLLLFCYLQPCTAPLWWSISSTTLLYSTSPPYSSIFI